MAEKKAALCLVAGCLDAEMKISYFPEWELDSQPLRLQSDAVPLRHDGLN